MVWADESDQAIASGSLSFADGNLLLVGAAGGVPRQFGFSARDVAAFEVVTRLSARLHQRPTLAIALTDGRQLRIAEAVGFGGIPTIADYLAHWAPDLA